MDYFLKNLPQISSGILPQIPPEKIPRTPLEIVLHGFLQMSTKLLTGFFLENLAWIS